MSMTMERQTSTWETRPGWGIAVDLTPHEVVQARQVRVHKRLIGLALVVVLALCAGVALITMDDRSAAEDAHADAQLQTTQLTAQTQKYAVLTTMQQVIEQVQTQVATLMAQDIDFVNLMARIRAGLPPGLELTTATVLLAPPADTSTAEGAAQSTSPSIVGSITLAGSAGRIRQVTPFVAVLNRMVGVVDVVPTSVTKSDADVQWTFTANITDELYTHRFDLDGAQ